MRMSSRIKRCRGEAGSATLWAVALILLASSTAACALIWIGAVSTRHAAEHAADQAALAAAGAAVRGLIQEGDPQGGRDC